MTGAFNIQMGYRNDWFSASKAQQASLTTTFG